MNLRADSRMIVMAIAAACGLVSGPQAEGLSASPASSTAKILHFPKDQSLGILSIEDRRHGSECLQRNFDPCLPWAMDAKLLHVDTVWDSIGVARGDVNVPANRDIALRIWLKPRPSELVHPNLRDRCFGDPEDLMGLSGLEADRLGHALRLFPGRTDLRG